MPRFLDRLSDLLVGNGYLLAVALGSLLLLFAAASFALLRFTGGRRAKHVPVTSINDEETIHRIVRKLHLTMRQAGEQGLDEETIFNPAIYEQMKADSKDLDRLLPNILINLYRLGESTLTTSRRMDLSQFVHFFNERTGANVCI